MRSACLRGHSHEKTRCHAVYLCIKGSSARNALRDDWKLCTVIDWGKIKFVSWMFVVLNCWDSFMCLRTAGITQLAIPAVLVPQATTGKCWDLSTTALAVPVPEPTLSGNQGFQSERLTGK